MEVFSRAAAWVSPDFVTVLKQQCQWLEVEEATEEAVITLMEGVAEKTGLALMMGNSDQHWQLEGNWHNIAKAQKILQCCAGNNVKTQCNLEPSSQVKEDSFRASQLYIEDILAKLEEPVVQTTVGVQTDDILMPVPEWPQGPFITPGKSRKQTKSAYKPTGRPRGRPRKKPATENDLKPIPASLSDELSKEVSDELSKEVSQKQGNKNGRTENIETSNQLEHENVNTELNGEVSETRRTRKIIDYSQVDNANELDLEIDALDSDIKPGRKKRGRRKGVPFKRPYTKCTNRSSNTEALSDELPRRRGRPRIIEPGTTWSCPSCDYTSVTKAGLKNHQQRKHKDRRFNCKFCNKKFGLGHDLERHLKSHTQISVCEICGKQYKTASQLMIHRQKHDPGYQRPEPLPCEICGKQFSCRISLKWHVESIHKGNRKTFLCKYCGKSFLAKTKMEDHENLHTGRRPYVCNVCSANFAHASSLSSHMLIHSGLKKYHCTTCGKAFRTSNNLRTHMQIHTGNPRFKCDYCGKSFYQKQALIRHRRIHTGEKPFQCEICGDKFNVKSILNRHLTGVHKLKLGPPGQPGRPLGSSGKDDRGDILVLQSKHENAAVMRDVVHAGMVPVGTEMGKSDGSQNRISEQDLIHQPAQTYLIQHHLPHQLPIVMSQSVNSSQSVINHVLESEQQSLSHPPSQSHTPSMNHPTPSSTPTMQHPTPSHTPTLQYPTPSHTPTQTATLQHPAHLLTTTAPTNSHTHACNRSEGLQTIIESSVTTENIQYVIPVASSQTEHSLPPTVTVTQPNISGLPQEHSIPHPGMVAPPIIHQTYMPPAVPIPSTHVTEYPALQVPVTSQSALPVTTSDSSTSYQQASDMLATLAASMALHTMSSMGHQS